MTFDLTNIEGINKLAQSVKMSGYYNPNEHIDDVAEKVAFILATTDILKEVDSRAGLVRALVRDLNFQRQYRETMEQEARRHNAKRNEYKTKTPTVDVTFCNLEALSSPDDEEGVSYDPADPKSDELKQEQHKLERELWTYENLSFFFREILKAPCSPEWHEVFLKTFRATWSYRAKGKRLILFKRAPEGLAPDKESEHYGASASIIAPYVRAYDRDVRKSQLWRGYLNRIRNLGGWSIPYRSRFHAALQQLKSKDAERVLNWLNYKYKVECYDDLKLFNAVFTATGTAEFLKTESSPLRDEDLAGVD